MLYIVGTGPGDESYLTLRAAEVLKKAEVILGHKRYIELISDFLSRENPQAEVVESSMGREVERARLALELSKSKDVALVSGGDPNIYGMANLVLEIMARHNIDVEVEIVPGISAFNMASAILGSPLMDVAIINLSDLLVPWSEIEKKLIKAIEADFVLALYNPASRRRREKFERVAELIKRKRGSAIVGVVSNASRDGESVKILKASDLKAEEVDMSTILIVGNSKTFTWKNYMITPRGYSSRYEI